MRTRRQGTEARPTSATFARLRSVLLDERTILVLFLVATIAFRAVTTVVPHRTWATWGIIGYSLALALALFRPNKGDGYMAAVVLAVVAPTLWLVTGGHGQPEIVVIVDGAAKAVKDGTPYLSDPKSLGQMRPYLPGLFVFGAPASVPAMSRAFDPRVIASIVLILAMTVGWFRIPGVGHWWRDRRRRSTVLALVSCPLVALAVATSFIDIPTAALTIAAFGALGSRRPGLAGVLAGATIAFKPTGIPIVVTLFALATRSGHKVATRFAASAALAALVLVVPVLLRDPYGLWKNAIAFPLGLTDVESPAQSPFVGVLLARTGEFGQVLALALLLSAAVAFAVLLWIRPPDTPRSAARFLGLGLTAAFLLAPASRAGYLVLPLLIAGFIEAVTGPHTVSGPGHPDSPATPTDDAE